LDEWLAHARLRGVTILEPKRPFGTGAAALIEGPDKIAIELLDHENTKVHENTK
jgi:hypothetical protein